MTTDSSKNGMDPFAITVPVILNIGALKPEVDRSRAGASSTMSNVSRASHMTTQSITSIA